MGNENIFVSLIVGLLGAVIGGSMNWFLATRQRHTDILSTRRKERFEKFIIYYSKISALAHPGSIKAHINAKAGGFIEKIIENHTNIRMLFDQRYQKDVKFVRSINKLVKNAVENYSLYKASGFSKEQLTMYEEKYKAKIKKTDKLLNIYVGTEWSRLIEEVKRGKPVGKEEWEQIYKKSKIDFCNTWSSYKRN